MIKHKRIGMVAALFMALAVLFLSIGYVWPAVFEAVTGSATPPYAVAMDKMKVMDIQIVADEKDWAGMLENAMAEEYIVATVVINGTKIENVGIRPKGNSSLSQVARDSTTDRYSFKIEFDQYVTGQTWLGLDKLALNNMQGDATYMKEYLAYDLMSFMGVATPLYAFSNITVNGEAWGFYLALETLEDSYATRVYGNDHGKLYKPESMGMRGNGQMNEFIEGMQNGVRGEMQNGAPNGERREMRGGFGDGGAGVGGFGGQSGGATLQYTDDAIDSYSVIFENAVFDSTDQDYRRVINAIKQLNSGENLERVVDVEATLRYFAAHAVIVNLDSYVSNMCHNYYLYEKDGQLTMLPWDFNLAFGGFQSGDASSVVNFPIDTPVSGVSLEERPMLAQLLAVPAYMDLYHTYLQQIVEGYFDSGLFAQTIAQLDALIAPYVEKDPTAFYEYNAYQNGVAELEKLGILRAQSIAGQLAGSVPSTATGQSENPAVLIDASSIDMSALGSMGGGQGGFGGMQGNRQNGFDEMPSRGQNGFGEMPNGEQGEFGEIPNRGQGGFGGGMRPGNMPGGEGAAPQSAAGFDAETWLILGGSLVLLLGGMLFVVFFKRRH